MKTYIDWEYLIQEIKTKTGYEYTGRSSHHLHKGLSDNGTLPISISEYEFNYIRNCILKYNFKKGFDLATGTVIGTLSMALALQENKGKLLSVDSYFEAENQKQFINDTKSKFNSSSFERNKKIISAFNLDDTAILKSGWSPNDCIEFIKQELTNDIDVILLDCPKSVEEIKRDIGYLKKYLNKEYMIFVHDTHCYKEDFIKTIKELFDYEPVFLSEFQFFNQNIHQHFPLAVITNIENFMSTEFAGDFYLAKWFEQLNDKHKFSSVIETGTHKADSSMWFAKRFPYVYTCENCKDFYDIAKKKLERFKNVRCDLQTSPEFLRNILPTIPKDTKTFIFLDAHWGDSNPLFEELEIINKSKLPVVIAIHDFKVPGTDFAYDTYKDLSYEWKTIEKHINDFNRKYVVTYNTRASGAYVGVIVIEFEEE